MTSIHRALCLAAFLPLAAGCGPSVETSPEPQDPPPAAQRARVSAHWDHACAIDADGRLSCWGVGTSGELGLGEEVTFAPAPVGVDTEHRYRDVWAGVGTTCGVRADGSLWCWGHNAGGALATGDTKPRFLPTRIGDRSDYAQVTVGSGFACAIREGGEMECWGGVDWGAPPGDTLPEGALAAPTPIPGRFTQVASHWYRTLAVRDDGTVWMAQNDGHFTLAAMGPAARVSSGPLDDFIVDGAARLRTIDPTVSPAMVTQGEGFGGEVSTSYHTCAIAADDSLHCSDEHAATGFEQVTEHHDWVSVGTGASFTCGARADGSIWCWGKLPDGAGGFAFDYGPTPVRL